MLCNAEKVRFRFSTSESPSWGIILNLKDLFSSTCVDGTTPGDRGWCPSFPASEER